MHSIADLSAYSADTRLEQVRSGDAVQVKIVNLDSLSLPTRFQSYSCLGKDYSRTA